MYVSKNKFLYIIVSVYKLLECENGTFGENCHSKCGHCLEVSHCHFINGSCLKGCSHGYKGDQCNDRTCF